MFAYKSSRRTSITKEFAASIPALTMPNYTYMQLLPPEMNAPATRRIMEARSVRSLKYSEHCESTN